MKDNKLKLKFYLNASHLIMFNKNDISPIHSHCWEIVTILKIESDDTTKFNKIEKTITDYLSSYEDKTLNDIYPFHQVNPTMEHIGIVFFNNISDLLKDTIYNLESLEVLENPTRTYIVNSYMDYEKLKDEEYERIIKSELNKARGIKNIVEDKEINNELNEIFKELNSTIIGVKKTQDKMIKKQKIKNTIFMLIILVLIVLSFLNFKTDIINII